jgi:hypothetical protein
MYFKVKRCGANKESDLRIANSTITEKTSKDAKVSPAVEIGDKNRTEHVNYCLNLKSFYFS